MLDLSTERLWRILDDGATAKAQLNGYHTERDRLADRLAELAMGNAAARASGQHQTGEEQPPTESELAEERLAAQLARRELVLSDAISRLRPRVDLAQRCQRHARRRNIKGANDYAL